MVTEDTRISCCNSSETRPGMAAIPITSNNLNTICMAGVDVRVREKEVARDKVFR